MKKDTSAQLEAQLWFHVKVVLTRMKLQRECAKSVLKVRSNVHSSELSMQFTYLRNNNIKLSMYIVGYYCDMADEPVTDYTPYPCPIGHYCTNGTRFSTEYPCPNGTYGPVEKLQSKDECSSCDAGMFDMANNWLLNDI